MAIHHISTILCDYMMRSAEGKLMIAGTFRNIQAPTLPISKAPMYIVVEFTGDNGDPFEVIIDGNGFNQTIAVGIIEVPHLVENQQWSVIIGGEIGCRFDRAGVFDIVLRSAETVIHRNRYGVILIDAPGEVNDEQPVT